MIKRSEIKVIWRNTNVYEARNFITFNRANYLYPLRKINSIYFDNNKMQMFYDSLEGIVPRKKIRIRNYGKLNSELKLLEIKTTFENHREKLSNKIPSEIIENKFHYDKQYGLCEKKIIVSFLREYFYLDQSRITLDYDINFLNIENEVINKPIDKIIIEFKSFNFHKNINLVNNLGLQTSRFSKYTESMENLNFIK